MISAMQKMWMESWNPVIKSFTVLRSVLQSSAQMNGADVRFRLLHILKRTASSNHIKQT